MNLFTTLWTKPIKDKDKLKKTLFITALSALYAKESGYDLNLYTDKFGAKLLADVPYANVSTLLEDIPKDNPLKMMLALGKFYALKEEPLGSIHIDYDVFIKKPIFTEPLDYDLIILYIEDETQINKFYLAGFKFLKNTRCPIPIDFNTKNVFNCGIIGINNQELKDLYLDSYFKILDYYKNYNANVWIDLVVELLYLYQIGHTYNVKNVIDFENAVEDANKIGYAHLQGSQKFNPKTLQLVRYTLKQKSEFIYNKIDNL